MSRYLVDRAFGDGLCVPLDPGHEWLPTAANNAANHLSARWQEVGGTILRGHAAAVHDVRYRAECTRRERLRWRRKLLSRESHGDGLILCRYANCAVRPIEAHVPAANGTAENASQSPSIPSNR
jgi:hypothetical protein